jgi:hypothetical protein
MLSIIEDIGIKHISIWLTEIADETRLTKTVATLVKVGIHQSNCPDMNNRRLWKIF